MRTIRTLVIDDEPLARARIIGLCQPYPFISVVSEAKNGKEATQAIHRYQPDLLFLDVQMPDFNGFEVLNQARCQPLPFIIFVTAFDYYAIKAFDVKAVDYLLKPFDNERFDQAVQNAIQQISLKDRAALYKKMLNLIDDHQQQNTPGLRSIEIKEKGRKWLVSVDDVLYFEAHGNYLKIHLRDKTHLYRATLQELEQQLDQALFLRIHRSVLLNSLYLQGLRYKGNNQYQFVLKNGTFIDSGRSYKGNIQDFLRDQASKGIKL